MQRTGLEWLFRLVQEPRRLWRRYLVTNSTYLAKIAISLLNLRQVRWQHQQTKRLGASHLALKGTQS